ncbi:hypothetical protein GCM10028803_34460 [Larkinella knui]|uniref:Glycosyltransferase RgtA/B/C/D-like domain-containing protein n=1 Tax=Larkinella knui TaxID=2025310 RepID=A0A3P1CEM8_9BACT|nr:DUF6056 family protein [Larkinella knui]RRB11324.1 hypothetical protein EHT87_22815 [Larkinella knui]
MKQTSTLFYSLLNVVALLLFGFALLPLLILSFYNHPSAVDDYCFADTAVHYGVWQAQKLYYDGWSGRYFSNLIVHSSPLVWRWYGAYRFLPALFALAWIGALYTMISELVPTVSARMRWVAVGLLFFLYVLMLPSPVEGFFWLAAVACYTVPTILSFYLIAVILRWYTIQKQPLKALTAIWAAFLVFAIVGSSETSLVWMILFLGGLLAYQLLFQRRIDVFLLGLLLMAFFSGWLLFRAPGNAIRMGGNPNGGDLLFSTRSAFEYLAKEMVGWFVKTPVLILGVLWLPLAQRLANSSHPTRRLFTIHPLLALIAWIGLLGALIFPSYYGIGVGPAPRVMNVVYTFFLLGWFYNLTVLVVFSNRWNGLGSGWGAIPLALIAGIAAVWVAYSVYKSVPLHQIYGDLVSGRAAAYDREMTDRQKVLNDPTLTTVRLPVLRAMPPSIFIGDIHPSDMKHWWNRCQAGYYGKKVVILDSLTAKKP